VCIKLNSAIDKLDGFCHQKGIASDDLLRFANFLHSDALGKDLAIILRMVISAGGECSVQARFFYDEFVSRMFAILQSILQFGISSGEFRQLDAYAIAHILLRTMLASLLRLLPSTCLFAEQVIVGESSHHLRCGLEILLSGLCQKEAC
jgi:hypothetical protein